MPYTTQQHLAARVASQYGYKIAEGTDPSEFQVGEGVIVLTRKGEPVMSGLIEKICQIDGSYCLDVGGTPWSSTQCIFRRM